MARKVDRAAERGGDPPDGMGAAPGASGSCSEGFIGSLGLGMIGMMPGRRGGRVRGRGG